MNHNKRLFLPLLIALVLVVFAIGFAQTVQRSKQTEACCVMDSCCCKSDSCDTKTSNMSTHDVKNHDQKNHDMKNGCCCCSDSCEIKVKQAGS